MDFWTSFTWSQVGWAAFAGFAVCLLDNYLTSAVLHRGLTHGAIRYPAWLNRAVAVWLWLTVCVPPLSWIAAHRHHHAFSDTPEDPHAPGEKGVWRVLLLTWFYVTRWARSHRELAEERYLRSFRDERLLHFLDRKDVCYVNFYGQIALSLFFGPAGITFWVVRMVPYMVMNGYVNAIGHTFGERPFPNLGTDAAGLFLKGMGYLIGGEPLGHNYHHRYPTSARFRSQSFDPGYWFATAVLRGRPTPRPALSERAGFPDLSELSDMGLPDPGLADPGLPDMIEEVAS
jgi:stearoyl-CoA desaturase (Delta-9 desaturase)